MAKTVGRIVVLPAAVEAAAPWLDDAELTVVGAAEDTIGMELIVEIVVVLRRADSLERGIETLELLDEIVALVAGAGIRDDKEGKADVC